ncbi:MAG: DUF1566 domain-containing protein [Nitrospira sp.]|nr:DUF1566 domain-containing protein [Nitrospira sp.]
MPACRHTMLVSILLLVAYSPGTAPADEGASRFVLQFEGEAVQDQKTGLVWEREPDYVFDVWDRSVARCATKTVGGRQGWRAPTIDEIKTLVDPDQQDP